MRVATADDAAAIAAIYAPFVTTTHVSFEEFAPSVERIREKLDDRGFARHPWVVCERDGTVAGYAYASPHRSRAGYRWSVDVSVYIAASERGHGLGTRTYRALFALLCELRYCMAYAGIALPNDASVALHRRVGFTNVGRYRDVGFKAGAWRDTLWFERPLHPLHVPPPEPLSLDDLAPSAIDRALADLPERSE